MHKILVIDDDESTLAIASKSLRALGKFEVVICNDSTQALDVIRRERPDLILLDIMMPKVDGFTICKTVKESDDLHSIKIIVHSAKIFDVDRKKALKLGADAYISKVIESDKLIETIHQVLEHSKQ
ncbi:response regulator [bacterium]|nr:response regulator [bacterium]